MKKAIMHNRKNGFTLIEMLVYLALMSIITLALVKMFVLVFNSNRAAFADSNIRNSAYSAMETMIEQIRASQSVDTVDSILYPSKSGVLELNQVDNAGNPYLVKFATSSAKTLDLFEGSTSPALVGPITTNGTTVTGLIFTLINTGNSEAVRIQMDLSASENGQTKSEWFYSTIVLRDSY